MQDKSLSKHQILFLMRLARIMPKHSVEEIYDNADAFISQMEAQQTNLQENLKFDSTVMNLIKFEEATVVSSCSNTPSNFNREERSVSLSGSGSEEKERMKEEKEEWVEAMNTKYALKLEVSGLKKEEYQDEEKIEADTKDDFHENLQQTNWNNGIISNLVFIEEFNSNKARIFLDKSKKIKKNKKKPITSSTIKRDHWTQKEEAQLLELYSIMGPKWTKIANQIGERTGKQVRDRYLNTLRAGINHEVWTKEEEETFERLFSILGKQWCKIAAQMPGRTENQVKNKFYTIQKHLARKLKRSKILSRSSKKSPKDRVCSPESAVINNAPQIFSTNSCGRSFVN